MVRIGVGVGVGVRGDARLPHVDLVRELACCRAGASEESSAVAVGVSVDQSDGLVESVGVQHLVGLRVRVIVRDSVLLLLLLLLLLLPLLLPLPLQLPLPRAAPIAVHRPQHPAPNPIPNQGACSTGPKISFL